jgi:cell division protein FtsB
MPAPVSTHDSRRATQVTLKAVTLLSGVLTVVFLVSFFFSDRGIAELQQARRRVDELQTDIQKLQAENTRLRGEIESAKNSTYAVEKIAREDLAMSKKGEVIYMLPASTTTTAGTPGPASPTPRP